MLGTLEITHHPGRLTIQRRAPAVWIESTVPAVRVAEVRRTQVQYERSDYRVAVNVLSSAELGRSLFAQARASALEGIAEIAREGDALGSIERRNTIGSIARLSQALDERTLNLAAVPPPGGTVAEKGGLDLEYLPGSMQMTADLAPVVVESTPARVTVHREVPSQVNVHV